MPKLAELDLPYALQSTLSHGGRHLGRMAQAAAVAVTLALLAAVTWIVYATGGTQTAYLHLAYVPVLLAASAFGMIGGAIAAMLAGFGSVGPLMPMDTSSGAEQPLGSWLFRAGFFLFFGVAAGLVIGHLRRQLRRIRRASYLHPVSRLPTQAALEQVLSEVIRQRESDLPLGLITVEVRNMDQIFNTLGPEITQHIPAAIVARTRSDFPLPWQIFHLHSGRIGVLVDEHVASAQTQSSALLDTLDEPLVVGDVPVYLDLVIGAASLEADDTSPGRLMQRSNIALAGAKLKGRAVAHYDNTQRSERALAMRLLSETTRALTANQFTLLYQPQFRLDDGRLIGAEALIRWQHPTLGLLAPGQFIPLLEATALINRLSQWVASNAIQQAAAWQKAGLDISVAFNVSPRNMDDGVLTDAILRQSRELDLQPHRLEMEITESAIIHDAGMIGRHLHALREAGIAIALDDFGDGYTSVKHLTALPLDKLKIDRSLVHSVTEDPRRMRIVSAVACMAQDLGLRTVAEGVEDGNTVDYLRSEGCDIAQGYFYGKPMSASAVAELASEPVVH
ncbi:EAL domain-containing protein (putative c-di-GMP-specific phosphodiesterase class I)/GGDEF domain-containing protein [Natronocella acetinitrilica]|uniref:EAL domain-containing protein (Putative c-di-GMP-specific phosphodiesterase class I)/GGDEF domain-containing protein n=1 Tax=Natronocella acetinitrilica TaxID=414046 RepID=A0AAE3KCW5_9GAMM|nr:GGDEF domain-containing phosphodiesterase [Natronocella acetinitrilica]MCP1675543.1 EAL domain-containing protein (putative c-di-GMP-specific phosphodiesterase class I)/GGDEF domain-containing protein [Natronocella acetinitrilica]